MLTLQVLAFGAVVPTGALDLIGPAGVLQVRPDFSIATLLKRDVLLERAEDRERLREGLIKAGFPS